MTDFTDIGCVELDDGRPVHLTSDTPFGAGLEAIMSRAEAFELVKRAEGKTPADWLSWKHLGTALHITGDSDGGLLCAKRAVELHRNATTLLDLAVILETFGRFEEALELSKEGNQLDPTNQFVGLLYAQGLLRQGRWTEAWPLFEHYCWGRIWEIGLEEYIPQWQGEPLKGKRILVLQGGGFGDNLMFMRWFRDLKEQGCHLTYACPDVMCPVLEGHPWIDRLLPTHEGPETGELPEVDIRPAEFDFFAPIMGLAKRVGATAENLRWDGPYIKAKYNRKLPRNGKPLVGLCWMGAEKLDPRRHRSLNREQTTRLIEQGKQHVEWVNLQFGMEAPVPIKSPQIKNWADTAATIESLDFVVTVDTGVMHLAGAMGKPVWALIPGLSDWKFLLGRSDSPFYPSLRLFRNKSIGLQNAMESVLKALHAA